MPYIQQYVPADVFLEHGGVTIYHAYEDGDYGDGPLTYWFSLDTDGEANFDVREMQTTYREAALGGHADDIKWSMREAIDTGLLTQAGVAANEGDK